MRVPIAIFLGLLVSCGQRSSSENKVVTDIKSYLSEGQHEAEILKLERSVRDEELSKKFYEAVKKNWDWYVEESKKAKVLDRFIPYDKRLGLTEKEYDEFLEILKSGDKGEYVKSSTEIVTISYNNNKITFKSDGQLAVLNKVAFDINESIVLMEKYRLDKVDTLNVTDDKNGFKSKWKGYRWSLPKNEIQSDSTFRPVSVTIGKWKEIKKHT